MSALRAAFAYPIQQTSEVTSSGAAEGQALLVSHQNAQLARDQFRAEIVWVAAERGAARTATLEERSEIGDEAIVARHQLVKLAATRDVLILEQLRLARLWRPHHRFDHFIINRCELGSTAREESRNHGKAMSERCRGRRMESQRNAFAREPVDANGRRPLVSNRPELVREMLLDERNLGLHRQFDICQRAGARTARHPGQDPGRTFLVHHAARAVDRVHDDDPSRSLSVGAFRHDDLAARQPLGHQQHRLLPRGDSSADLCDELVFSNAVDRVDRIALCFRRDA